MTKSKVKVRKPNLNHSTDEPEEKKNLNDEEKKLIRQGQL